MAIKPNMYRIGFHSFYGFHYSMLEPIYSRLREHYHCLITSNLKELISFKPQILITADERRYLYRQLLPDTVLVWIRHGFASKNVLGKAINGSDFTCISSESIRDEYINKRWQPCLGYWVTGFVPMDAVFRSIARPNKSLIPNDFLKGNVTILYAPTYNRNFNSVEMLGENWIEKIRELQPGVNVIIKPHPHIPRLFPHYMQMWQRMMQKNERVLIIQDPNANIYDYLPLVDILISDASSVMFYFLALDKPIIVLNNPLRQKDVEHYDPEGPEWAWRDCAIQLDRATDLPESLVMSINNPDIKAKERAFYREIIFGKYCDGQAADRIADKVRALIEPKPEETAWVEDCWKKFRESKRVSLAGKVFANIWLILSPFSLVSERYPVLKKTKYFFKKIMPTFPQ